MWPDHSADKYTLLGDAPPVNGLKWRARKKLRQMTYKETNNLSRRNIFKTILRGTPLLSSLKAQDTVTRQMTVRDRFRMYGQEPGAEDVGRQSLDNYNHRSQSSRHSRSMREECLAATCTTLVTRNQFRSPR